MSSFSSKLQMNLCNELIVQLPPGYWEGLAYQAPTSPALFSQGQGDAFVIGQLSCGLAWTLFFSNLKNTLYCKTVDFRKIGEASRESSHNSVPNFYY